MILASWPGLSRPSTPCFVAPQTWMPATSAGMTIQLNVILLGVTPHDISTQGVSAPAPTATAAPTSRAPACAPGLRLAAAVPPRACEESSARPPAAWRCLPPFAADHPRVALRAGRHFGVPMRDRAQAVANRVKRRRPAPALRERPAQRVRSAQPVRPAAPTSQAAATRSQSSPGRRRRTTARPKWQRHQCKIRSGSGQARARLACRATVG
jgi:hypothetical protein